MEKARNLWRDLPQGGSRYGSVLTRLFLLLCLLATTQAGWAQTNLSTSAFYQFYANSEKTYSKLIEDANLPSYITTSIGNNQNGNLSAVPSISSPHDFSALNTNTKYYRLKTGSNSITITNVANLKKVHFYGNGSSSTRTISTTVTKESGSGSTFTVAQITGISNSNATIAEYSTVDFSAQSGYDASTYYTYVFTFSGDVSLWGIYLEAGSVTGPTINTQPASANYDVNATPSALTVAATASSGDLSYQWYKNTDGDTSGKVGDQISGATSATLAADIISTAAAGTTYYYCIVTDGAGSTTSSKATIKVIDPLGSHTLTWNLNTNTTTLGTESKTSTSTYIAQANLSNLTANGPSASGKAKTDYTPIIGTLASYNANNYMYVTFTVADGYQFTPTSINVIVQPVSTDKDAKIVLTDGSNSIENTPTNCKQGQGTTISETNSGAQAFTGTVTLKIYCYGATDGYRLGTPITITGNVAAAATPSAPTAPTFSPASGSLKQNAGTVTATSATSGSTVYYKWSSSSTTETFTHASYAADGWTAGTADAATATATAPDNEGTYYLNAVAYKDSEASTVSKQAYTIDGTAPTLSSSTPADGATGVATSGTIVLTFNEAIASVDATKFSLSSGTKDGVAIDGSDNTKVNITYSGMANNTAITLTTAAGAVTDAVGNTSAALDAITFTTVAAEPTATFNNGSYTIGGDPLDLSTLWESNSTGTVTYTVTIDNGTGATISGSNFTATTAGTATVKATQAAAGSYSSIEKTATITVNAPATVSAITKATTENGSFTVKVGGSEVTEATSGATVTVTTTPNDGYEVDAVTLSTSGSVSKESTNNYTFTMPASAVTVTVSFKESTSTKAAAPTITYTLSDGVTITNSGTTYTIINPDNKDQKVKVKAKKGTYVRFTTGNSEPSDPTKSSGTEVNGLSNDKESSGISVSKGKTVFYIKAIAFTDKNGSNPSDIVLFTFNTRKAELDDPTITQDDGNTFKEGEATKHATFTTNADGATTYYVIGNEAKTKASDITSGHAATGLSEEIDLSSFVTAEKDVVISAVSEKDGKYSEIVTTTYTYNGTKTYTVVTNNPKFRIGQRDEVLITNIKDKNGKKILFGQEEGATIDYSQYFTFSYELATNEEAQAFDASISDNAANKDYVVAEEINTSVIQSKDYTLIDEEQLPKSFIVKVTATPKDAAKTYVKDESVVAYAKVTVKKRAYTGIGYAEFYWDIERTSQKLQAGTDYRVVTEGDLKNYGVFDEGMSVPNGRVIFLKVAGDETVGDKTWHHSRDVDHFCYYYGSSKLGDDKAVSDVQYYNNSTKVYRNNLIPLLISSNNGNATKKYVDDTTEEGKNILWVTVQGYEADGSQYGSPIKMKIYLTANDRPAGPTYDPSENKAIRNTSQTVAANGTGTSDVFAKFSSEGTYYHELELIHEEGIIRGRNSAGVFSTEVAARKITGSQVTKVGDYYYLSNQSTNVYDYRFATTLKMDRDVFYVNVGDEFIAPTITGTYFNKSSQKDVPIDLDGKLSYTYTYSNGADDTKVNETTGVVYTENSGSTENNKIGTKSGTVVVTVKFTSDKTKNITVNSRTSVLDDAEIKYTINIVNPEEHTATISPLSRKFAGSQVVKIEADDEWDTYYTTNGDEPTATESETNIKIPAGTAVNITVGGNIEIGQSVVVKAKPFNGSSQGKLVSETYEKVEPIAAPTFVPDGTGEPYYYTTKTPMEETKNRIEIRTTTAGASVYYMIDNPKVTTSSNQYDGLSKVYINFNSASSHTIYAFAYKDGVQSEIVSSTYRYTTNIDVPVFHANGNNYSSGSANVAKDDEITITGPTGSTIYYTLDGTDPSVSNGQKYESGFNIFKTTTAKAVAISGDATSKITTVVFNVPTPEKDENDFWEAIEETTPNGKLAVADRRISLIKNGDVYAYNSVKAVKGITATFGGKDNQGWAEANILEASLGSIIDGVGKYNIRNENEPEDELDNAFTPLTTSKTTTHERTFGLPAQGCFVRFEPTEDGQLTIWTMQQGALHYTNSNDNRTLCSRIIRFRPVYMIDEQGKSLTAVSRESTARLSEDWSKLETTNWLPNDGSEDQGEKNIYTSEQSTAIYNLINGLVGTKQAGDAIEPYEISGNNAIYNTLYGAAPSSDLTGYIMPSGGYVKYTFNLKAGKSYYFFANNSRVCVRGFRYVIDSSADTEDVALEDEGENDISSNSEATTDNVTITNRTFAANTWTALLLPFSMSATQVEQTFGENTRVIHFEKYENYKLYWKNHYYDMIVAGTPVLIYPTKEANISGLKVQIESKVANDPTGDNKYQFNGTYNRGKLNKWDIFVANTGVTKQWTGDDNKPYKSLRAWITGFESTAKARSTIIGLDGNEEDDVTTGIYEIPFEGTDAGDTFAKGNNNVYSVSGMLIRKNATSLEGLSAGVYIINGKKVVIND